MKLLLAEDTNDLNRAVSALLAHQGYEVTSAFDGAEALADRIGVFPVMVLTSLGSAAVFCNQIMPIILSHTLLGPIYEKRGYTAEQLAMDMENICITVPAFVPWAIICSVPLRLLGADYRSMLLAVFLYAIPIFNGIARRRQYRAIDRAAPDACAQGDPKE